MALLLNAVAAQAGSESEFGEAQTWINFQNMRGGRVQLLAVPMPDSDYFNEGKGEQ